MSKSRGNVINPDEVVKEYGADSLRLYEMFHGAAGGDEAVEHCAAWRACTAFWVAYGVCSSTKRSEGARLAESVGKDARRNARTLRKTASDDPESDQRPDGMASTRPSRR